MCANIWNSPLCLVALIADRKAARNRLEDIQVVPIAWAFSPVLGVNFYSNHRNVYVRPTSTGLFYLPMHAVRKESSSTTKVRAVFDASAKSSSGVSLNDTLMVGPTVHFFLIDVMLQFHLHRVALTTDVSRMYQGVQLTDADKDFHRFVWRKSISEPLHDYRMKRVTLGIPASSFAVNMAVKRNTLDLASEFPHAAHAVEESFYVDDGLVGADTTDAAILLQKEL